VDCGLKKQVIINKPIQPGVRVTVSLDLQTVQEKTQPHARGTVVSPAEPREKHGIYWGYQVRLADTVSQILNEGPWGGKKAKEVDDDDDEKRQEKDNDEDEDDVMSDAIAQGGSRQNGGYDLVFGLSERGKPLKDVIQTANFQSTFKGFKHALVIIGGTKGLEYSVDCDEDIKEGGEECEGLFDAYVNPLPEQVGPASH
jgi:hypothetical protein